MAFCVYIFAGSKTLFGGFLASESLNDKNEYLLDKGPGPGLGVLLPRQGLGLGYGSEGEG